MATLLKVLNSLADIKSAGGVALRVRTPEGDEHRKEEEGRRQENDDDRPAIGGHATRGFNTGRPDRRGRLYRRQETGPRSPCAPPPLDAAGAQTEDQDY